MGSILETDQLDRDLELCGVKYVFVESGMLSTEAKCEEIGIDKSFAKKYWCELSWGSGPDDEFDFAFADFGDTLGKAITACMQAFAKSNSPQVLQAKKKYGWRS